MAQCARKNANVLLTGEVAGKNITVTVKVYKNINNFEKRVVAPTFYVTK